MRALSAEETALWERVTAEVRAFHARPPRARPIPVAEPPAPTAAAMKIVKPTPIRVVPTAPARPRPGTTLDGSWDRRLIRGEAQPDVTIDLHGHNLSTAYDALDRGLAQAAARGARLVLLVTGKPPAAAASAAPERGGRRGAIRAAVGDWLHASRHAGNIAAVRNAAPRHGGAGALYIVLRRG